MKKNVAQFASVALIFGMFVMIVPRAQAQGAAQPQKLQALTKQLNLTPEQKAKLVPILEADAPKVEAIKGNTSLGGLQKLSRSRPFMPKAILR